MHRKVPEVTYYQLFFSAVQRLLHLWLIVITIMLGFELLHLWLIFITFIVWVGYLWLNVITFMMGITFVVDFYYIYGG